MTRRRALWAFSFAGLGLLVAMAPWKPRPLGALVSRIDESANLETLGQHAIELVPSIRPPTSVDGRVRIVVYLQLPAGATIRTEVRDGVATLEMPPGTLASRVEALAEHDGDDAPTSSWRVLDVRATLFGPAEEQFRLLRPRRGGGLIGIAWPRSLEGARQAAAAIPLLVEEGALAGVDDEKERAAAAARLVRMNDCASCHVANHSETRAVGALVQKRTDASGLFQVLAVLSDDGPFEQYRPKDPNETDPFVSARCGDVDVPRSTRTRLCADGLRPRGHLDLPRAMAAGSLHARRVCAARAALASRIDALGREVFRDAFAACGPGVDSSRGETTNARRVESRRAQPTP